MVLMLAAVGDALGFPIESGYPKNIQRFVEWKAPSGFKILRGEYSDDTQLTLAMARSIWEGEFQPEYFAYVELPLWIYYQKGAGKSSLNAAMNLLSPRIQWHSNIYPGYEEAGGTGAAMRVSPIALVAKDLKRLTLEVTYSTLITHGHPLAFVGSIGIASTMLFLKISNSLNPEALADFLLKAFQEALRIFRYDKQVLIWRKNIKEDFENAFRRLYEDYLRKVRKIKIYNSYENFCEEVGEFKKPGNAFSSTLCSIFILMKYDSEPVRGLLIAANTRGTDTDTIASMSGALFGFKSISEDDISSLKELIFSLQDRNYLKKLEEELLSGGKKKEIDRDSVRKYAMKLEQKLKIGDLPKDPHPIFGELRKISESETYITVHSSIGQTLHFKKGRL